MIYLRVTDLPECKFSSLRPEAIVPIYDQRSHPRYGACRRLFVALSQIMGNLQAYEAYLLKEHDVEWAIEFAKLLDAGNDESWSCRKIIRDYFV